MREDLGLGRDEFGRVAGLGQNILRLEIDDAAEAGDEMRGLERHPVEGEIGKAREHFRLGLALEIAPACLGSSVAAAVPMSMTRAPLQRVALLALVDHERDARVGENILGVHGKARDQQERRPVGRGRDIHQRAIGIARAGHQRRQGPRAALAQELLGGSAGLKSGVGFIGASAELCILTNRPGCGETGTGAARRARAT